MIQNIFNVPGIFGKLSKEIPQSLIQEAISAPPLHLDNQDGLDHKDPKDRRIKQSKVQWIIDEMTSALNEAMEEKYTCESYWLHVHNKNMSTNTHSHLPSIWSAACYLNTPKNSGKICFMIEELGFQASLPPKAGDFIIFPSGLKHYVTAHGNDEPRVCISVNWKK